MCDWCGGATCCDRFSRLALLYRMPQNGIPADVLQIDECPCAMAVVIADAMAHGVLADCPNCRVGALVACAGRIVCWNPHTIDGQRPCTFEAPSMAVQRFRWRLPKQEAGEVDGWLTAVRAETSRKLDLAPPPGHASGGAMQKRQRVERTNSAVRELAGLQLPGAAKKRTWAAFDDAPSNRAGAGAGANASAAVDEQH